MTTVYKKSICEYDDEHEYEVMDTGKKEKGELGSPRVRQS